jgi:hypothetical protein
VVIALSSWWMVGWAVSAVVVLLVAVLILSITFLARKIDGESLVLTKDLDSIARKTQPLQAVGRTNVAVRAITRGLTIARGEQPRPHKYSTSPGWRE